jgi:hypothetical protein
MMGHSAALRRLAGVVTAVSMVMVSGGVGAASVDDDLAVAMQGVKRGLRALESQRASLDSGAPDSRLAVAVAAVDDLVAERIETDPTLSVDDVLEALVSEVPETGDSPGPLGEALDAVKLTGQDLAEEKRGDAPGQADEDRAGAPASPGNAGGNNAGGNNAGGNNAGGNNAGDAGGKSNAGGKGNAGDAGAKGNAGGGGGNAGGSGSDEPEG